MLRSERLCAARPAGEAVEFYFSYTVYTKLNESILNITSVVQHSHNDIINSYDASHGSERREMPPLENCKL